MTSTLRSKEVKAILIPILKLQRWQLATRPVSGSRL